MKAKGKMDPKVMQKLGISQISGAQDEKNRTQSAGRTAPETRSFG